MIGAAFFMLAVTKPDGTVYQRGRLLTDDEAERGASLALAQGARMAAVYPDCPAAALLGGRLSGDFELVGSACRILGEEAAAAILRADDATGGALTDAMLTEWGGV